MLRSHPLSCLVFALVALATFDGCASSAPAADSVPTVKSDVCAASPSIDAYCASRPCPSFEEEAAAARVVQPPGSFYRWWIGACGPYRFVRIQEGMGLGTDWFGADGKLVATSSVADAPQCNGEFSSSTGTVASCVENVLEHGDASFD